MDRRPYSIRILLESAIRNCGEFQVTGPFKPTRVLLRSNGDGDDHLRISGFAARLSTEEVAAMEAKEGFLYAPVWAAANRGEGVIIGVVDSGINPTHVSFDDTGYPPPPARWHGLCEFNNERVFNNKLLGVRNFDVGSMLVEPLPVDTEGHGTHVASTAAGNEVLGASIRGRAWGTASGAAPGACLAIYKASNLFEIMLAIGRAIKDGVDIICISTGAVKSYVPFFLDKVAIAVLWAVKNGILVCCSVGNNGPLLKTLRNDAPWIMTVRASTTDRGLRALLWLGDDEA